MPKPEPLTLIVPSTIWAERYEALRAQATGSSGTSANWGLALACRQGLAAWMRAWPHESPPAPKLAGPAVAADTLPADLRGQIALVMADMILTRQQEVPV
jgi:hypothetical protein